ncbi:intraflagellar transport protein 74 homolog [Sycon ciliatum]|uniref:intraflagellar transport protein 74 homolog n=1 Tax=Sycon ciliatum TaxID=27933 RepID=UPI0020AE0C36|eukprot:scpid49815/ scgid22852/ Intraflagellar transport protein 74 homolog; Capillary morphogenesis gene 1 protein; Coiled-coil domain-containing protein 2
MSYRPPTGSRKPPGTAGRGRLGMGSRAGPGTRAGGGEAGQIANAIASQLHVSERPITQHGVAGMKTGVRGPERGVYDKSYYLGMLRNKITELRQETRKMQADVDAHNTDQSTYMAATKQAEQIAIELREEQGALTDFNLIVEVLNTTSDMSDIGRQTSMLKANNDREAMELESLFFEKSRKEQQISELEHEIEVEKTTAHNIVSSMSEEMRDTYQSLQRTNKKQMELLEQQQREVDDLHTAIAVLNEELDQYPQKRRAAKLHQQIIEAETAKRAATQELEQSVKESPDEERVRLLEQVRTDNRELAGMEKLVSELEEKTFVLQEELQEIDSQFDEELDAKLAQYKKVQAQQAKIASYLSAYPGKYDGEKERGEELDANISVKLDTSSRLIGSIVAPATEEDLKGLQDDLSFKVDALMKSGATAEDLETQHENLKSNIARFSATEAKLQKERMSLDTKISQMTSELELIEDIAGLREGAKKRGGTLTQEKNHLDQAVHQHRVQIDKLSKDVDQFRLKLEQNDTNKQIRSWERVWQQKESNIYTMEEFIKARTSETNFEPLQVGVRNMLDEHNADITSAIQSQISASRIMRDY